MARIKKNGLFGFVDTSGRIVITPSFEDALPFSEGFSGVKSKGKWGFIDKTGNMVVKPDYQAVKSFREQRAVIKRDKKYGYVDNKANIIVAPTYSKANSFSNGFAAVSDNQLYGYIAPNGDLVIDYQFFKAGAFNYGIAHIIDNVFRLEGYINTQGQILEAPDQNGVSLRWQNTSRAAGSAITTLVSVSLSSTPSGADIYMIPLSSGIKPTSEGGIDLKRYQIYKVPDL